MIRRLASFVRHQVLAGALPVVGARRKHGDPDFLALPHRVRDSPRTLVDVGAVRLLFAGRIDAEPALAVDEQPLALFLLPVGRLEKPLDAQLDVFVGPDDHQGVALKGEGDPLGGEEAGEFVLPLQPQGRRLRGISICAISRRCGIRWKHRIRPVFSRMNSAPVVTTRAVAVLGDRVDLHPHQDAGSQTGRQFLFKALGRKSGEK